MFDSQDKKFKWYWPTKTVILFGPTQCGKSTFIKLLKSSTEEERYVFADQIKKSIVHDLYSALVPIIKRQTIAQTIANQLNVTNVPMDVMNVIFSYTYKPTKNNNLLCFVNDQACQNAIQWIAQLCQLQNNNAANINQAGKAIETIWDNLQVQYYFDDFYRFHFESNDAETPINKIHYYRFKRLEYFFNPSRFKHIFPMNKDTYIPTKQDVLNYYEPTTDIKQINLQMQHAITYLTRKNGYVVRYDNYKYQMIDCPPSIAKLRSIDISEHSKYYIFFMLLQDDVFVNDHGKNELILSFDLFEKFNQVLSNDHTRIVFVCKRYLKLAFCALNRNVKKICDVRYNNIAVDANNTSDGKNGYDYFEWMTQTLENICRNKHSAIKLSVHLVDNNMFSGYSSTSADELKSIFFKSIGEKILGHNAVFF